jgi:GAF domain-containing protein
MDATGPAALDVRGTTIRLGEGLSGWVAAHRQVIVNSEAALDLGSRARHMSPPLLSALGVPLVVGESLIGTVALYSSKRAAFTEDQSRLMQIIAPHIAQAIRTAQRAEVNAEAPTVPANSTLELVASR